MIRLWRLPRIAQLLVAAALAKTHHLLSIFRVQRAGLSTHPSVESAFLPMCSPTGTPVFPSKAFLPGKLSWYYSVEITLRPGPSRECNPRGRWLSLVLKTGHEGNREPRVSRSLVPCCTPLSKSLNQEQRLWQNWGISTPKPNGAQYPGYSWGNVKVIKSSHVKAYPHKERRPHDILEGLWTFTTFLFPWA